MFIIIYTILLFNQIKSEVLSCGRNSMPIIYEVTDDKYLLNQIDKHGIEKYKELTNDLIKQVESGNKKKIIELIKKGTDIQTAFYYSLEFDKYEITKYLLNNQFEKINKIERILTDKWDFFKRNERYFIYVYDYIHPNYGYDYLIENKRFDLLDILVKKGIINQRIVNHLDFKENDWLKKHGFYEKYLRYNENIHGEIEPCYDKKCCSIPELKEIKEQLFGETKLTDFKKIYKLISLISEYDDFELFKKAVLKYKEIINYKAFREGGTLLSKITKKEYAEFLVNMGADIDIEDDVFDAIYYAVWGNSTDVAIYLFENTKDFKFKVNNYLDCSIEGNNLELVKYFGKNSINFNIVNGINLDNLLHTAARTKKINIEIVNYLIENKVDINFLNIDCKTPLDIAIDLENDELIKLLKSKGAKKGVEFKSDFCLKE